MVMMELVKARTARGRNPELYFYLDSHGNEIDVLTEGLHFTDSAKALVKPT